ncbi:hypothetical protein PGB90_001000 [Kerria lacca]
MVLLLTENKFKNDKIRKIESKIKIIRTNHIVSVISWKFVKENPILNNVFVSSP